MPFIFILALSAAALAGSAAYFSVIGLAVTFSGAYYAVLVMGGALEVGKLVAASYLYRYWNHTKVLMKLYLIAGIISVMGLTSVGVFGYLSAGYQAEMLPMKQMQEHVIALEEERKQTVVRKRALDEQIASAGYNLNVNQANGRIDPRAVQAMRQAEAARKAQVASLEPEQKAVTARMVALDKEILDLKTQQIMHEAKIGPIMYIAEVFGLPPDNATKYLIFLIIFAFDPMAVVLTLAVNIALRIRRDEQAAMAAQPRPIPPPPDPVDPPLPVVTEDPTVNVTEPVAVEALLEPEKDPVGSELPPALSPVVEAPHNTQLTGRINRSMLKLPGVPGGVGSAEISYNSDEESLKLRQEDSRLIKQWTN